MTPPDWRPGQEAAALRVHGSEISDFTGKLEGIDAFGSGLSMTGLGG